MREVGCNHTIRPKTIRPMTNGPTYTKSSPIDFTLFVPLAAVVDDTPSARAMDPAAPRRGHLQIHLLVVALTVFVALVARSGAEVITLTEETFSDKVTPPAFLVSGSLLSLRRTFQTGIAEDLGTPVLHCLLRSSTKD